MRFEDMKNLYSGRLYYNFVLLEQSEDKRLRNSTHRVVNRAGELIKSLSEEAKVNWRSLTSS